MKKKSLGANLINALDEAVAFHEGKVTLRTSQVEMPADPPLFSSRKIKKIREALNVSQPIFAKYLGVSDKAVKGWERGAGHPSGSAARLIQIAEMDPQGFHGLILSTAHKAKSA